MRIDIPQTTSAHPFFQAVPILHQYADQGIPINPVPPNVALAVEQLSKVIVNSNAGSICQEETVRFRNRLFTASTLSEAPFDQVGQAGVGDDQNAIPGLNAALFHINQTLQRIDTRLDGIDTRLNRRDIIDRNRTRSQLGLPLQRVPALPDQILPDGLDLSTKDSINRLSAAQLRAVGIAYGIAFLGARISKLEMVEQIWLEIGGTITQQRR